MPRLPLGELDQAQTDPIAFRQRIDHPEPKTFRPSYFSALRDAVFEFHKPGRTLPDALSYLEERLDRFSSRRRATDVVDQFAWYVAEFANRGLVTFHTRLNIRVSLPSWAPPDLVCSGQIARVDIVPTGGYAAWLFRAKEPGAWSTRLQMPLMQRTIATSVLGAPLPEVSIGVISFKERLIESRTYTLSEVDSAFDELEHILRSIGYSPPSAA